MSTILTSLLRDRVEAAYRKHVNSGLAKLFSLMGVPVEVRSAGAVVYGDDGAAYLDAGGYGVFLLGHCHPLVVAAVREQLENHPLSTRVMFNPALAAAATALAESTPADLQYVVFTNSGAEAVEVALKLARLNGSRRIVAMDGGFHGKTMGALSVTGREAYRLPFAPLLPDVNFVTFGDIDDLERALDSSDAPACVILEPVQAEAGVILPPPGYLRQVSDACATSGAFLIVDEIQTGLGRLGRWWGMCSQGMEPDVLLVGKTLSGGAVPVGAAVATPRAFMPFTNDPLLHSSTFAGNPLAMAAVQATLQAIRQEGIIDRSATLGRWLLGRLRTMVADMGPGPVNEVRGEGLLIGLEFKASHLAMEFVLELLDRKVLVSHSLNAHQVVRLTPPAILTDEQSAWLVDAVGDSLLAVKAKYEE